MKTDCQRLGIPGSTPAGVYSIALAISGLTNPLADMVQAQLKEPAGLTPFS